MIDLGPDGGDKAGRARSLKARRWMGRKHRSLTWQYLARVLNGNAKAKLKKKRA